MIATNEMKNIAAKIHWPVLNIFYYFFAKLAF